MPSSAPPRDDSRILVTGAAPDLGLSREACLLTVPPEPCTMVIFGATGDLTAGKLIPALYRLYLRGVLPDPCPILGLGRTPLTTEQFREHLARAVAQAGQETSQWPGFAARLEYVPLNYTAAGDYENLARRLKDLEAACPGLVNRIFYLAVPPSLYGDISARLGQAGLAASGAGWVRLVVEKPFGRDLPSARALNRLLQEHFRESQIFRIDHYMAKETVQNILVFRFANAIFEPLWNRNYIDWVGILAAETVGVGGRGSFYEETGVLRDMFQNHMMHLLALTAMEPPTRFAAEPLRDEEVKVFRSLKPLENLTENLILGQYTPGRLSGGEVPGYRQEPRVSPDSLTPTFAALRVLVDNWRWRGVPFWVVSGKRLPAKLTRIIIQFREVPHSLWQNVNLQEIAANRLLLGIQPEEKITLTFETKNPGATICLRPVTMEFSYFQNYQGPVLEAYEKSLLDALVGDQTLFWRQDAVEACWEYFSPVIEECERCADPASFLQFYPAGTWGPETAWPLLARMM